MAKKAATPARGAYNHPATTSALTATYAMRNITKARFVIDLIANTGPARMSSAPWGIPTAVAATSTTADTFGVGAARTTALTATTATVARAEANHALPRIGAGADGARMTACPPQSATSPLALDPLTTQLLVQPSLVVELSAEKFLRTARFREYSRQPAERLSDVR